MPKKPTYVSFQSEGTDIAMKDDDVEDIEDEDDQHASQDSNSSENNNLENMLSLVAQLRDTRAKKKREAEKKFLKVARTQVIAETQQTLDQALLAARTIDEAYTKFTVDYASIEDKIREKWEEIRQEQATLVKVSVQARQQVRQRRKNTFEV
ncbi:hypothetical protein ONZ45_g700 [Pleurotus djamor]|nr:hypothetical protein ONZ45_g700 [Pleurotus djamor]